MQPTDRKIDQPWLRGGGVQQVMQALAAGGGCARFVGGCVRDALFGRAVRDIDIATDLEPETVMSLLIDAGLKYAPTGLDHGTVTAIADGQGFEVTTLRHDVETDGRRAVVAFTDDWLADAQRRDFIMNALYCDADGTLYDPVGGLDDIADGRVRFIGDADDRITEDFLRILRFFRFHAWYGAGGLDAAGLDACARQKAGLTALSVERVRSEFLRLLEAPDPLPALQAMADSGVLAVILPGDPDLAALARVVAVEQALGVPDAVRRLAALYCTRPDDVITLAGAWKMSNSERKRLRGLRADIVVQGIADRDARAQIYRHGVQAFCDHLVLHTDAWAADAQLLWDLATGWDVPALPVSGRDVTRRGVAEGKQIGEVLAMLEDGWVAEDFIPTRQDLLDRLDGLLKD